MTVYCHEVLLKSLKEGREVSRQGNTNVHKRASKKHKTDTSSFGALSCEPDKYLLNENVTFTPMTMDEIRKNTELNT